MANREHLKILEKGPDSWNKWRALAHGIVPDLSDANLRGASLAKINLAKANLRKTNLRVANLTKANLSGANLSWADLSEATLSGANLHAANLFSADLFTADLSESSLSGAELIGADLTGADLNWAVLRGADLSEANLSAANLNMADLSGANLSMADLSRANLNMADLSGANLNMADLHMAQLSEANFEAARFGVTILANTDLSSVKGIETVEQDFPSSIGIDTIYKSKGRIPDVFLRDAGVPEEIIEIARLIRNGPAIEWQSCFISYSHKDEAFARRLYERMREAGMRVWYAPEDIIGGKKFHEHLFEAIQIQDRLFVVLSEHSIQSEWLTTAIRKAREEEKRENRRKLFPIRLTDHDTLQKWSRFDDDTQKDLAAEARGYFISDFSNWKDHASFESAFEKLHHDLRTGKPNP